MCLDSRVSPGSCIFTYVIHWPYPKSWDAEEKSSELNYLLHNKEVNLKSIEPHGEILTLTLFALKSHEKKTKQNKKKQSDVCMK